MGFQSLPSNCVEVGVCFVVGGNCRQLNYCLTFTSKVNTILQLRLTWNAHVLTSENTVNTTMKLLFTNVLP